MRNSHNVLKAWKDRRWMQEERDFSMFKVEWFLRQRNLEVPTMPQLNAGPTVGWAAADSQNLSSNFTKDNTEMDRVIEENSRSRKRVKKAELDRAYLIQMEIRSVRLILRM
jgi:hypothetical protein